MCIRDSHKGYSGASVSVINILSIAGKGIIDVAPIPGYGNKIFAGCIDCGDALGAPFEGGRIITLPFEAEYSRGKAGLLGSGEFRCCSIQIKLTEIVNAETICRMLRIQLRKEGVLQDAQTDQAGAYTIFWLFQRNGI